MRYDDNLHSWLVGILVDYSWPLFSVRRQNTFKINVRKTFPQRPPNVLTVLDVGTSCERYVLAGTSLRK